MSKDSPGSACRSKSSGGSCGCGFAGSSNADNGEEPLWTALRARESQRSLSLQQRGFLPRGMVHKLRAADSMPVLSAGADHHLALAGVKNRRAFSPRARAFARLRSACEGLPRMRKRRVRRAGSVSGASDARPTAKIAVVLSRLQIAPAPICGRAKTLTLRRGLYSGGNRTSGRTYSVGTNSATRTRCKHTQQRRSTPNHPCR